MGYKQWTFFSYHNSPENDLLLFIVNYINVGLIAGIFERHRLSVTENSVSLDVHEIEDVLSDIYFAAQKDHDINFNVEKSAKLAINYIYKIFKK